MPAAVGSPIGSVRIDLQQAVAKLVGDRFVDDQPAQRRAALAAGADGGEDDRADGEIEIGRRRDDHAVVAAEFEQRPAEPLGDGFGNGAAHRHGAGGRDERHLRRRGELLADVGAADRRASRCRPARPATSASVFWNNAWQAIAQSGVFSDGFQTIGIAADPRERGVPRPDGNGKVERRDDADGPERMPLLHQAMAGAFAGDRLAVELAAEADGELADVDHLLDFAQGFLRDLARFPADDRGELALVLAKLFAEQADEVAADGSGNDAPLEEGFGGGIDRGVDLRDVGAGELGERAAVDRGMLDDRLAAADLPIGAVADGSDGAVDAEGFECFDDGCVHTKGFHLRLPLASCSWRGCS